MNLRELGDVADTAPADGDVYTWSEAAQLFVPGAGSGTSPGLALPVGLGRSSPGGHVYAAADGGVPMSLPDVLEDGWFTTQTDEGVLSWDAINSRFDVLKGGLFWFSYDIALAALPGVTAGSTCSAILQVGGINKLVVPVPPGTTMTVADDAAIIAGTELIAEGFIVLGAGATVVPSFSPPSFDDITEGWGATFYLARVA